MKLVYKLLDFFRGNKRKKPINKSGESTVTNPYLSKEERLAIEKFERNMRKEREIGVHPKYRNRQSRYTEQDVENWETLEKEWEKKKNV